MSTAPTPPDDHDTATSRRSPRVIPHRRERGLVVLRPATPGTSARERPPAPGTDVSLSQPAVPAALDPTTSPLAQAFAFGDRLLADEDRTRRARSLLAPVLRWSTGLAAVMALAVLALVIAGVSSLAAGLLGLGPAGGHLLLALGVGGLGGGAALSALSVSAARRLRTRIFPEAIAPAPAPTLSNSADDDAGPRR